MKWICFLAGCFLSITSQAQVTLSGKVLDGQQALEGATVIIKGPVTSSVISAGDGSFSLKDLPNGEYILSSTFSGYKLWREKVSLAGDKKISIEMTVLSSVLLPVEVKALRAADNAPFAKTNLDKTFIEKNNLGQDIPFVLNQTPNVVVNSDAGNGIGYTGIRIRGSDASRINMTINGIPYNDAESQGSYFVDLPDFLSSASSVQIQRGVGTSSNGAGAFGASMNFSTHEYNEQPYAELNTGAGSFNSLKATIKFGSGLINKKFTIDGRLSGIRSDGFIDRAKTDLQGAYFSAAYWGKKSSLKLNVILGKEKTYQAWNGIPEAKLNGDTNALLTHYYNNLGILYNTPEDSVNLFSSNNRTYNYFTYKNQTDNYWQNHYQLFWTKQFNSELSFNTGFYLTTGRGYYEEYKVNQALEDYGLAPVINGQDTMYYSDLVRRLWLDNKLWGQILSLQYQHGKSQITLGGGWSQYNCDHYGEVIWTAAKPLASNRWYDMDAKKTDANLYAKWQYKLSKAWTLFADVQYRYVHYTVNGFRDNPDIRINETWNFLNPKAGISFNKNGWSGFMSYAMANKEPNRDDFEAGKNQLPKREQLHDFELNVLRKNILKGWNIGATFYYMAYKDQLVLTGKINDVGSYTRINIPKSYRAGVEIESQYQSEKISINYSIALSQNKLKDFTEYLDDYDNGGQASITHGNTTIALSPAVVQYAGLQYKIIKNGNLEWMSKYVSKEFLDNTGSESRKLDAFFVNDVRAAYSIPFKKVLKEIKLVFQLNNIFNVHYEPNGYTYSYIYGGQTTTENFYYPMAGINFMTALNIRF